jgi:hypothetical protein
VLTELAGEAYGSFLHMADDDNAVPFEQQIPRPPSHRRHRFGDDMESKIPKWLPARWSVLRTIGNYSWAVRLTILIPVVGSSIELWAAGLLKLLQAGDDIYDSTFIVRSAKRGHPSAVRALRTFIEASSR